MPPLLTCLFGGVCIGALVLLLACHVAADRLYAWNSVPWAFQLRRAADVKLHCALYAAFHSTRLGRRSHHLIVLDVAAWFVVLWGLHPGLLALMLAGLLVLARRIEDRRLALALVLLWGGCAASAIWCVATLGGSALRGAQVLLLANAVLRFVGHLGEPVPPLVGATVDRFRALAETRLGSRVLPIACVGYLSEFAAGLPWGLIRVHAAWLVARLSRRGADPSWAEAVTMGARIRAGGLQAYPPIAAMVAAHLARRVGAPPVLTAPR